MAVENGRIIPSEPEKLPERATGVLTLVADLAKQNFDLAAERWADGYFDRTAGAFADEPLERPSHLSMEYDCSHWAGY